MTTTKEIEEAVAQLPKEELAEFMTWFHEFESKLWDKQLEEDVNGGKLDRLADQALKDLDQGQCSEL